MSKIINFSVILPTYNRGNVLFKTIESVVNQTYEKFELLVIDDASNDDTHNIVKKFNDKRIRYFKNTHSGLPAVPRNFGIKNSKFEWICFLDSDDLWYPKKLEIVKNSILSNENILLFCHNEILIKNNLKSLIKHSVDISSNFYRQLLVHGNKLSPSAVCLNKKYLIEKKILFNENVNLKIVEDYDFWLNFFQYHNDIMYINEVLSEYIVLPDSISNNTLLYLENLENLYINHVYNIQKFTKNKNQLMNKLKTNLLIIKAKFYLNNIDIYKFLKTIAILLFKYNRYFLCKLFFKVINVNKKI